MRPHVHADTTGARSEDEYDSAAAQGFRSPPSTPAHPSDGSPQRAPDLIAAGDEQHQARAGECYGPGDGGLRERGWGTTAGGGTGGQPTAAGTGRRGEQRAQPRRQHTGNGRAAAAADPATTAARRILPPGAPMAAATVATASVTGPAARLTGRCR